MRPFSFSAVYNRFFSLLSGHFGLIFGIGLLMVVGPTVGAAYSFEVFLGVDAAAWSERFHTTDVDNGLYVIGAQIAMAILNLMATSILIETMTTKAAGKRVDGGKIFGHAIGNILPLIGVSILVGLTVLGGFILLIVPGIIWALATSVATPLFVSQPGVGVSGAVSKSFELTRGHRWELLAVFLVGFLMLVLFSGALPAAEQLPVLAGKFTLAMNLAQVGISDVADLLGTVFVTAIYLTLRESKTKASPELTADVFS